MVESVPGVAVRLHHRLLGLTVVALLLAAWFHFVGRGQRAAQNPALGARVAGIIQSPLAIAAWVLVVFEVLSLTLAMTDQYPAWSVGRSNLEALTGKSCGLADDVMVEQDPNAGMLHAGRRPRWATPWARACRKRFTPNGIPADVRADPVMERRATAASSTTRSRPTSNQAGTEGGTTPAPGINGSRAQLPYNLDPARTPVLGSWRSGIQVPATLRSGWYRLPATGPARARCWWCLRPAASTPARCSVQWATDDGRPADTPAGRSNSPTSGASPAWRNLRLPMSAIPSNATQVRAGRRRRGPGAAALDRADPAADSAAAHAAGSGGLARPGVPGLARGLAFPCQRPFGHQNGVDETPKWRILPDRFGAEANSPVMDNNGGGPLGVTELLVKATTHGHLSEGRLVARLGRAATADALLPQRPTRPPVAGDGDAQRPVGPGPAETLRRTTHSEAQALSGCCGTCIGRRVTLEVHHR